LIFTQRGKFAPFQQLNTGDRADNRSLLWRDPNRGGGSWIDWGVAPHPASALPAALSLESLTAIHPDADRIRAILDALGERDVRVEAGREPALRVALR
jgi:hypothetical protein